MSRFISDKSHRLNLGDDEWVEIKDGLPFIALKDIMKMLDAENAANNIEMAMPLLKASLVKWNLKDADGKDVPCNEENIEKLDFMTIMELMEPIMTHYMPEKKSLKQ